MDPQISSGINQLRAVAALWVFVFHYEHFIAHDYFKPVDTVNPVRILVYNGYAGVSLFFCLSGFLFARNYCLKPQLNFGSYYAKRLLRILPGFTGLISIFFVFFNTGDRPFFELLTTIFYFDVSIYPQAIGHLWSINRELQCYALFPVLWLMHRYLGIAILGIIALLSISSLLLWAFITQPILPNFYGSFNLRFLEFLSGVIAAIKFNPAIRYRSTLLIALVIYLSLLTLHHILSWRAPLAFSPINILWLCFNSVSCLILMLLYIRNALNLPKLITRTLQKIGEASYSFYLYHFLVIGYFANHRNLLSNLSVFNFTLLLIVSLSAALIAYQTIEKPALTIKKYLFAAPAITPP